MSALADQLAEVTERAALTVIGRAWDQWRTSDAMLVDSVRLARCVGVSWGAIAKTLRISEDLARATYGDKADADKQRRQTK